ncbi:hypothetical protein NS228_05310 [Methylobacterium indicum]|uniref:hypothetical protein n=1 Tax=Methylobacterium indicum TaxID=1775910 RepID=UPI000734893B|nr:hypothetical protein [Methylobacterium indicum]KTS34217.1 hypothetical protein NS229_11415 [Methylobacterium indicum]KTS41799.1 hypothetical protein NS228_05310 [Methylobacterium indicum]KTS53105.1 hypothetical protein NS230_07665 [Methylobacterium indicum]
MRQFNLGLNLTTDAAKAIAKAMSECALFETSLELTDRVLAALAKADLVIVPKPVGNADAVREAVRTGNWSAVSERDLLAWRDAPREEPVPTGRVVDVTHVKEDGTAETVRHTEYRQRAKETVTLEIGNVVTLPPGTDVRAAGASSEGRDNLGLCPRSADDMAERFGCRVEVSGMDEADTPLTEEFCEVSFVVVTERATGRVVGLVQAWETDDGDPLVPMNWLSTVLSAWDAARDPQQAA